MRMLRRPPRRSTSDPAAEALERLFELAGSLPAAIYTKPLDPWGRIDSMSPSIVDMLGYPAEEWIEDETLLDRAVHADDYDRVRAASERLRETREPLSIDYRLIASDGRVVHAHDATVYVPSSDDRSGYLHGILVASVGQDLVEEQLRALRTAEMLGRFAGGIVHDFRNSLSAIGGYASLLERELS